MQVAGVGWDGMRRTLVGFLRGLRASALDGLRDVVCDVPSTAESVLRSSIIGAASVGEGRT
jgi:hypothetical protein